MAKPDSMEKAGSEGVTVTIKGKEYKVNPFTIGDYLALRAHIKGQRLSDFLGASKELDSATRAKVLVELSSQTISETEIMQESIGPNGMVFMLWRSLSRDNSSLKLEDMDVLLDEEDVTALMAVAEGLNAGDDEPADPPKAVAVTDSDGTTPLAS